MKKSRLFISIIYVMLLSFSVLLLTACKKGSKEMEAGKYYYHASSQETEVEEVEVSDVNRDNLYLIVANNSARETMVLYHYESGLEYQYQYTLATNFIDKYGNHMSVLNFTSGKAVYIDEVRLGGQLGVVQMADVVWEYDDITRFSIDESQNMIKIADSKYSYTDELFVFSNGMETTLSEITDTDELFVLGMGKKILSVVVTTGHGTLALTNTSLFDESFIQLNNDIFAKITPDMQIELQEGQYKLTVANDGWGGTTEVTVVRGETVTVDLDAIKGDGPQYGEILFAVSAEDATLIIDGEKVDFTNPIRLKYGIHSLVVEIDGYVVWKKYLCVNSKEATVIISLEEEDEEEEETTETNSETETETESESEPKDTEKEDTDEPDLYTDFLSTISDLLTLSD